MNSEFSSMISAYEWVEVELSRDNVHFLEVGNVIYSDDGYTYFLMLHGVYREMNDKYEFTYNVSLLPTVVKDMYIDIVNTLQRKLLSDKGIKAW